MKTEMKPFCKVFGKSYMPLSPQTIKIVKATAPVVGENAVAITQTFYPTMFKNNPEALQFFNKTNQAKGMQAEALADSVVAYAMNIDKLGNLGPLVKKITNRHCALGVTPELYKIVHDNLMKAIGEVLGDAVTPEIGKGWSDAVMGLSEVLADAEEELYCSMEKRAGGWRGYREFELAKRTEVAEDTVAFDFAPVDKTSSAGEGFEFDAGQYLSIRLDAGEKGSLAPRHYTVTSPSGGQTLQCTTRRIRGSEAGTPAGVASSFMHESLKVGDRVNLSAPCGVFTRDMFEDAKSPVAFVTAGVGATPALALAQDPAVAGRVEGYFHVDRAPKYDGLSERVGQLCNQKVQTCYTHMNGHSKTHDEVAEDLATFAREGVENVAETEFVLCGPTPFMQQAYNELSKAGAKAIHHEVFGTGSLRTD